MKLPTIEELRKKLEPLTMWELFLLCQKSGAAYGTVDKIRRGKTDNPSYQTVAKLWRVL